MIGDNAKEVIKRARRMDYPRCACVSYSCEPLKFMDTPDQNPNLFYTYGRYHVTYNTYSAYGDRRLKKYCIFYDFGNRTIKCENYNDFKKQAETNEAAKFFLNYSNISEDLFNIAANNEGMQIPFSFDIAKYDKDMREKIGNVHKTRYAMTLNPFKEVRNVGWRVIDGEIKQVRFETNKEKAENETE